MDSIHLDGAEDVRRAGNMIDSAADTIRFAANNMSDVLSRHNEQMSWLIDALNRHSETMTKMIEVMTASPAKSWEVEHNRGEQFTGDAFVPPDGLPFKADGPSLVIDPSRKRAPSVTLDIETASSYPLTGRDDRAETIYTSMARAAEEPLQPRVGDLTPEARDRLRQAAHDALTAPYGGRPVNLPDDIDRAFPEAEDEHPLADIIASGIDEIGKLPPIEHVTADGRPVIEADICRFSYKNPGCARMGVDCPGHFSIDMVNARAVEARCSLAAQDRSLLRIDAKPPHISCHASRDGDCSFERCPQEFDGESAKSGRHCPLDNPMDYEER